MTAFTALSRAQLSVILILAAALVAANIHQPFPDLAPLQHAPTALLLIISPGLLRRWPLSDRSTVLIGAFLLLHTFAGRYIYSYVPYDLWAKAIFGHDISSLFGWRRNGFDRLVHFAFGLLLTLPFAEIAVRHAAMPRKPALVMAFALVGLISALYEIFEWALTLLAAGDTADYYNGQQGDMWDAQKDMALALAGSMTAIWATAIMQKLNK